MFLDAVVDKADDALTVTENASATGAGNGADAPDWAADWAYPSTYETAVNFAGEYDTDLTLDAATTYSLDGACIIKDGATLTIPAGTVITAQGGTTSYIAIAQGGKIMVEGTATAPVVMTCTVEDYGTMGWSCYLW